ncbi:unnamed protein product [Triticum turgidum subsp. durum]|uniref:B box-type domain-containing protein n=1 Tax=Triticum turgidum subsp. durum TaxID=4567 RepID=A0A9R0Y3J9_TRITD|nr:unnamed protein product [Triticum turgidum subsp. durum]
MQSSAVRATPQWLRGLLSEEFFDACAVHPAERKNDKNHFCADCAAALCRHCLPHDPSHNVLQIWKYASCFVVRVDDLKLFDCTGIQVKHLGESERGLRCALRVNRKAAAAGEEAAGSEPQNGKRPRAASSEAEPSCGGSSGQLQKTF